MHLVDPSRPQSLPQFSCMYNFPTQESQANQNKADSSMRHGQWEFNFRFCGPQLKIEDLNGLSLKQFKGA